MTIRRRKVIYIDLEELLNPYIRLLAIRRRRVIYINLNELLNSYTKAIRR